MIEVNNLTVTFNRGEPNELTALRNVTLTVPEQQYVIVLGSNGSGKSTLLNCLAGNRTSPAGTIRAEGRDISRLHDYERSAFISRIFQDPLKGTAPELTVLENFRLAALRGSSKTLRMGISKAFSRQVQDKAALLGMGLENRLHQQAGTLSGGQRQALTLLMAVMSTTRILLLDEPAAALDPKSAITLMQNVEKMVKEYKLTALLVTHNLKDAFQYGDRIIQMQEGAVLRDIGPPEKSALSLEKMQGWFG
jgi:putative tryptophan/tyrosine transport system ATP-binding protein